MREKLLIDLKNAMKNQNKELLSVVRMVKGAMQLEEIKQKRELNDDEMIAIIHNQIKTRKDAIVEFQKGGREDLVKQNEREIALLEKYMPAQMPQEEVLVLIDQVFEELKPTSPNDMGKIMGHISPIVKGKADLGFVNKTIREKLENLS